MDGLADYRDCHADWHSQYSDFNGEIFRPAGADSCFPMAFFRTRGYQLKPGKALRVKD